MRRHRAVHHLVAGRHVGRVVKVSTTLLVNAVNVHGLAGIILMHLRSTQSLAHTPSRCDAAIAFRVLVVWRYWILLRLSISITCRLL